ncbi:MAG: S-methyl-5-thioribose-1-phosphate isomerase, partial [Chlorobiaceae bacterium]|nr:S-methyl-5-thioribose-1-phosphate isomerase [Chlorobiaceae bacterium]
MVVRGAGAIGAAGGYGVAQAALEAPGDGFDAYVERAVQTLTATRPTARNLFWAIERMQAKFASLQGANIDAIKRGLVAEAVAIDAEDVAINERIGRNGAELVKDGDWILTHCNAGGLATAGYGTAVG